MLGRLNVLCLIAAVAVTVSGGCQAISVELPPVRVCPGAFPTDLTANPESSTGCSYTAPQRTQDFVTGAVTDQPILSATVFGLGAQIIQSPSEWKRTWYGYGMRVGSRYTQAVGKGTAEYITGLMLNDDPRFLAYSNDPGVIRERQNAVRAFKEGTGQSRKALDALTHDGWQRFGHAWYDVITVRRSARDGDGRRIPAFSRFAGEIGGAYAGYPWYPGAENKLPQVGERAAGAFGTAVLSSFWTEYQPDITNLLGKIFRRGRQPKSETGATT
jgi:hypothetical protein